MNHAAIHAHFARLAERDDRLLLLRDGEDILIADGFVGLRVEERDPIFQRSPRRRFPHLPEPDAKYATEPNGSPTPLTRENFLAMFRPSPETERVALTETDIYLRIDDGYAGAFIGPAGQLTYVSTRYLDLLGTPWARPTVYTFNLRTNKQVYAQRENGVVYAVLMPIMVREDPLLALVERLATSEAVRS